MAAEVFIDTSGFYAQRDQNDPAHERAKTWLKANRGKFITVTTESSSRLGGSRNVSSPKSSNPVWRRAAANRASICRGCFINPAFSKIRRVKLSALNRTGRRTEGKLAISIWPRLFPGLTSSHPSPRTPSAPRAQVHRCLLVHLSGFKIFVSQFVHQTELLVSLILCWITHVGLVISCVWENVIIRRAALASLPP
jgi:hypothetical protein